MSNKKVSFGAKPTALPADPESWIQARRDIPDQPDVVEPVEPMKRLTIDIPESLHRAVKMACASRGSKIADEIRQLLLERYGDSPEKQK